MRGIGELETKENLDLETGQSKVNSLIGDKRQFVRFVFDPMRECACGYTCGSDKAWVGLVPGSPPAPSPTVVLQGRHATRCGIAASSTNSTAPLAAATATLPTPPAAATAPADAPLQVFEGCSSAEVHTHLLLHPPAAAPPTTCCSTHHLLLHPPPAAPSCLIGEPGK